MTITLDDIKVALSIVDQGEASEVTLRSGDIEVMVRRGPPGAMAPAVAVPLAVAPVAPAAVTVSDAPAAGTAAPGGAPSTSAVALHAPLTGVIYRAPAPGETPFTTPGATVTADAVVCIIDVMKVMNLIKAPAAGRVLRIDVQDGQLLNKDDVILWVEPG